jgi:cytokinesis protein
MDDLLQKLRAAKPEARDQRDRRRRARLKDRHQVRVASGQKIPEIGVNMEDDASNAGEEGEGSADKAKLLSPTSETNESETSIATLASPTTPGADVADRAAAMLEGLQRPDSMNKDGSLSVRRRRETADSERERRRRRRQQATSKTSEDSGLMSPSIPEEGADGASDAGGSIAGDRPATRDGAADDGDGRPVTRGSDEMPTTPTTVVVPPSPEQKGRDLPTPPPDES